MNDVHAAALYGRNHDQVGFLSDERLCDEKVWYDVVSAVREWMFGRRRKSASVAEAVREVCGANTSTLYLCEVKGRLSSDMAQTFALAQALAQTDSNFDVIKIVEEILDVGYLRRNNRMILKLGSSETISEILLTLGWDQEYVQLIRAELPLVVASQKVNREEQLRGGRELDL
ncbi:MAG: hypothetical protein Q8K86_09545 [Candidatus Nanopelagicaceae bacterium]|nr:hypothetical protein [Candidatus Nanopelagicaceae bacterium]